MELLQRPATSQYAENETLCGAALNGTSISSFQDSGIPHCRIRVERQNEPEY